MQLNELAAILNALLEPTRFKDYCPNGLQVEGRSDVRRIVTGVTASAALLDAAIALGADAILVHHGYFWRGEDPRLIGPRRTRIAKLIQADVSLFGFHLPLDAHPTLGNNAQLAQRLGFTREGVAGEQDLVVYGTLDAPCTLGEFGAHVAERLGRTPQLIGELARPIRRIAWCSGGAQSYFDAAIEVGVDAFLTGEISEPQYHQARESGVAYIAAGHHATERFGIQAVGAHLAEQHGLEHRFVDIPNPV
jgi:dinuclear metal center YbgI/SA1388 family protein